MQDELQDELRDETRNEQSVMVARRVEYLAPLFAYLQDHHHVAGQVAREAGVRGGRAIVRQRLWQMKLGVAVTPPWFVAQCCAVIGRPVAEVMGAEWVSRFGADGAGLASGGTEEAPVGPGRIQKPPRRHQRDGQHVGQAA
ncbi:MAG TPA: hypothetical protein VFU63_13565 [Ktedonobacterales bacterium]|nr:hypothetical protein [Ktedonobacterales bacterium]